MEEELRNALGVGVYDKLFDSMGAVVSGSYALLMYMRSRGRDPGFKNNDIDIWVPYVTREALGEAIGERIQGSGSYYYGGVLNPKIEYVHNVIKKGAPPVQLIVLKEGVTVEDAIYGFDISVCRVAWEREGGFRLFCKEDPCAMVTGCTLVWPVLTLNRLAKYHERGWRLDQRSKDELLWCFQEEFDIVDKVKMLAQ